MKNIQITWSLIGEFFAASLIIGAAFWGPWLYYILTGDYMEFR